MNFVFFDTECANCLNGNGKICSFGYTLTDSKFEFIKKKDILINPEARFLLGNAKNGDGISLAYPLYRFNSSRTFPFYHLEIKRLLENPNNIIFGFAVSQDINYLIYTCSRYHKEQINYKAFDIQLLVKKIYQERNLHSLEYLIVKYNLESYIYHRSDDDAYMSMEIFKKICEELNMTPLSVIEKFSDCFISNTDIAYNNEMREKKKKERKELIKKYQEFSSPIERITNINNYDKFFIDKKIVIERKLFNAHVDEFIKLKPMIYQKGGSVVGSFTKADYIVIQDKSEYQLQDNQCFILYKNFIKKF